MPWALDGTSHLPIPSPDDAPKHLKYLLLGWQEAIIDERHMKKPADLNKLLSEKAQRKEWVKFGC